MELDRHMARKLTQDEIFSILMPFFKSHDEPDELFKDPEAYSTHLVCNYLCGRAFANKTDVKDIILCDYSESQASQIIKLAKEDANFLLLLRDAVEKGLRRKLSKESSSFQLKDFASTNTLAKSSYMIHKDKLCFGQSLPDNLYPSNWRFHLIKDDGNLSPCLANTVVEQNTRLTTLDACRKAFLLFQRMKSYKKEPLPITQDDIKNALEVKMYSFSIAMQASTADIVDVEFDMRLLSHAVNWLTPKNRYSSIQLARGLDSAEGHLYLCNEYQQEVLVSGIVKKSV